MWLSYQPCVIRYTRYSLRTYSATALIQWARLSTAGVDNTPPFRTRFRGRFSGQQEERERECKQNARGMRLINEIYLDDNLMPKSHHLRCVCVRLVASLVLKEIGSEIHCRGRVTLITACIIRYRYYSRRLVVPSKQETMCAGSIIGGYSLFPRVKKRGGKVGPSLPKHLDVQQFRLVPSSVTWTLLERKVLSGRCYRRDDVCTTSLPRAIPNRNTCRHAFAKPKQIKRLQSFRQQTLKKKRHALNETKNPPI